MEPRVLTIQDFSCLGRCSLTVAIPTISAAGCECVSIPTAILSNHTAFKSWTFLNLTDQMLPIVEKWKGYRHDFDYIYTGYLSNEQIPTVLEIIKLLKEPNTKIVVDPAMADHGKLYPGFDNNHVKMMKELIKVADIIVPNLTEACLLTDSPFPGTETEVPLKIYSSLMVKLSRFGAKQIIISGQEIKKGVVADLIYDYKEPKLDAYGTILYKGLFHGTGDLFASAFVGALARGASLKEAVKIAHDYVHEAINFTNLNKLDGVLYGPDFESAIPSYVEAINNISIKNK